MSCGGDITIFGLFPETDTPPDEVDKTGCDWSIYARPICEVVIPPDFAFITTVPYNIWSPDGIDSYVPNPLNGSVELKSNTKEDNVESNISIYLAELIPKVIRYEDISEDGMDSGIAIQGADLRTIIHRYTDISQDGTDSNITIQAGVLDTIIIHTEVYTDGTLEDIESNIAIVSGALV